PIETRPVRSRVERSAANKKKDFIIKFSIIMIPISFCVCAYVYGFVWEQEYKSLKQLIIESDSIMELKNKLD
ncbi:MAG: hypothetical protein ACRDB0_05140, partial [Paraclostridium sp.]